jgi:PPOX class probable F420-dependent enzyme
LIDMPDPFTIAVDYEPGRGPGPIAPSPQGLARLLGEHRIGVLATFKRNGYPHLATMAYAWSETEQIIRISSVAGRAKPRHLRHDPRAALYVTTPDHLSFAVAEGAAEVSPPSTTPGDGIGRELLAMQAPLPPEDQAAFLTNMVTDRRLVIRLRVSHLYGGGLDARQQPGTHDQPAESE